MEISFCSYPSFSEMVAMKFCIWHDSSAVVACKTLCINMILYNGVTHKTISIKFELRLKNWSQNGPLICVLAPSLVWYYSIHVPGWLQKWLNLITAPGSVSNEPGSVTWLATKYLKTVSWRNHTEKLTTWWPQNISFWPKINIPSSYFTILMLNCLENTLKLQFDSYVTAVRFLT